MHEANQEQLPPCSHCKAIVEPTGIPQSWVRVRHEADCFYALIAQRDMMIPRDWWEAWSRRASSVPAGGGEAAVDAILRDLLSTAHVTTGAVPVSADGFATLRLESVVKKSSIERVFAKHRPASPPAEAGRCEGHCEHDPRWMGMSQDGLLCMHPGKRGEHSSVVCGHRCDFTRPAQEEAARDDAVEWLKKVYAMGVSENSVVPQQNAGEMLVRLDGLGFGKQDGRRGNTLFAMVMDCADEVERLRAATPTPAPDALRKVDVLLRTWCPSEKQNEMRLLISPAVGCDSCWAIARLTGNLCVCSPSVPSVPAVM